MVMQQCGYFWYLSEFISKIIVFQTLIELSKLYKYNNIKSLN